MLAGLLGFLLYYGWIYWSSDRVEIAEQYLVEAEYQIEQGSEAGLWELAKAYMLGGIDKAEYHRREGVYLAKLNDSRAEGYLSDLIEAGNVNDEVWFEYARILMDKKDFNQAEYVINQISDEIGDVDKLEILTDLAYIEGSRGKWDAAGVFLEQIGQLPVVNERGDNLQLAYGLLNGEINTEFLGVEQVQELNEAQGDVFVMMVANVWMNMGLTDWSRALLSDLYWQSTDLPDLDYLFVRSYLLDGDCAMAELVMRQFEQRVGDTGETKDMQTAVRECWGK